MKKTLLILIFGLLTNLVNSQEIQSQYIYRKEKSKSKIGTGITWNVIDSDSLVLYADGTFYRRKIYQFHAIDYLELKGEWTIENDSLRLQIKIQNRDIVDERWSEINSELLYKIKGRKLVPINGFKFHATQKLKRFKK